MCPRAYQGLGTGSGFRKRVGFTQSFRIYWGPIPTRGRASLGAGALGQVYSAHPFGSVGTLLVPRTSPHPMCVCVRCMHIRVNHGDERGLVARSFARGANGEQGGLILGLGSSHGGARTWLDPCPGHIQATVCAMVWAYTLTRTCSTGTKVPTSTRGS